MPHAAEKGRGGPSLDDLAMPHHGDLVRHRADHAKIVADQQQARIVLRNKIAQQGEDLSLRGDVERSGRLVRDDEARRERHGHADNNALPLATREFMRVACRRHEGGRAARRAPEPRVPVPAHLACRCRGGA